MSAIALQLPVLMGFTRITGPIPRIARFRAHLLMNVRRRRKADIYFGFSFSVAALYERRGNGWVRHGGNRPPLQEGADFYFGLNLSGFF